MKSRLMILFCLCVLLINGCAGNSSSQSDNYLEFAQNLYKEDEEAFESIKIDDGAYYIPSLSSGMISIKDTDDNVISTPIIEYTGGSVTYKLVTSIHQEQIGGPERFKRVFYILIDGYLQPFYFEDSDEPMLYADISTDSSNALSEYIFTFAPMYVPYGKNAVLSFVISDSPDYFQKNPNEQVFCSSMEQNYCLTAETLENAVSYKKEEIAAVAYTDFPPDNNQTVGFALTEQIQNEDQFKLNTLLKTDKQLYATSICTESRESIVYAIVDGKPANIFNGSYYVDLHMEAGKTYEIPLDMDYFEEDKMHQIYFVDVDKGEIEAISCSLTGNEIMAHSLTHMVYAYAVTIDK